MAFAAALILDDESSERIKSAWELISRAGISSFMLDNDYRPHLTLGVCEGLDEAAVTVALKEFSRLSQPVSMEFSHIGVFAAAEGVVFYGVTPDTRLLEFHRRFFETFCKFGQQPNTYYLPNRWVPHCTLAFEVNKELLAPAVRILKDLTLPIKGSAHEIAVIEAPPWKELATIPLGLR